MSRNIDQLLISIIYWNTEDKHWNSSAFRYEVCVLMGCHAADESCSKANVTPTCWCSNWLAIEIVGRDRNSTHKDFVTLDMKWCEQRSDRLSKQSIEEHSKIHWLCYRNINVYVPTFSTQLIIIMDSGLHYALFQEWVFFVLFFLPWCGFLFEPVNLSQGLIQLILHLLLLLVQLLSRFSLR